MSIGTVSKRNRSLISFGVMLLTPDSDINNVSDRASGLRLYYLSGECDDLEFLLIAGFTAVPTSGEARLKVKFTDGSTYYNVLQEVEQSTVNRYMQDAPCTTHYIQDSPIVT